MKISIHFFSKIDTGQVKTLCNLVDFNALKRNKIQAMIIVLCIYFFYQHWKMLKFDPENLQREFQAEAFQEAWGEVRPHSFPSSMLCTTDIQ